MIVRISMEDQYRLPDGDAARLNELDNSVVKAVEAGDEGRFAALFQEMLEFLRSDGERLADDVLEESDVILPPADTTISEAADDFSGDGLIPE